MSSHPLDAVEFFSIPIQRILSNLTFFSKEMPYLK